MLFFSGKTRHGNQEWLLAKNDFSFKDSRRQLKRIGFAVVGEEEIFYKVRPPEGWTKTTSGYWTGIFDQNGKERMRQFYKYDPPDRYAKIVVLEEPIQR